jgi:transposase
MENIMLIGIDLGKNSFHIHCQDHRRPFTVKNSPDQS